MKHDSFARFLKSDVYKQALIGEMEGRPLPYTSLSASHSKIKTAARKVSYYVLLAIMIFLVCIVAIMKMLKAFAYLAVL